MNARPTFVVLLALALIAFFSCKARADEADAKWNRLHVAFVACVKAKGATAQHACAADYASLALEIYGDDLQQDKPISYSKARKHQIKLQSR